MGQVGVIEGQSVADTPAAYWNVEAGRWFGFDDHRGFNLQLDEFRVDWVRSLEFAGQPSLFEADVTVTQEDGSVRSDTIAGNVPMVVDDFKIHLLDWGYAPVLEVAVDGEVVWEGTQAAQGTSQGFFRTAIKVPASEPDIGFQVGVYPYAPDNDEGVPNFTGAPWPDAPVAVVAMYEGDLALTSAQNVNILETEGMELAATAFVRLGETVEVADGVEVSFPELRTWAGFQVSYRPTVPLLLGGALLLLLGLIPALYAYRRRLWVEVVDGEHGGTLVTVAGRTFQRADAFAGEFADVAGRIAELAGASPDADPPREHDSGAADDTGSMADVVRSTATAGASTTRPDAQQTATDTTLS